MLTATGKPEFGSPEYLAIEYKDSLMLITTTHGPMDDALLERKTGVVDNEIECTDWTEYWLSGELVHRSVHVRLKTSPVLFAEAAAIA
jgi:hypothetical protein